MSIQPFEMIYGPSTAEQRKLALQHTRETLTSLRDLLKELDLPVQHMELAKEIYSVQLVGLVSDAEREKMKARNKRRREKLKAMHGTQPMSMGQMVPSLPPMSAYDMFDDDDDDI